MWLLRRQLYVEVGGVRVQCRGAWMREGIQLAVSVKYFQGAGCISRIRVLACKVMTLIYILRGTNTYGAQCLLFTSVFGSVVYFCFEIKR